jgi:hypothetical protein
MIGLFLTLFFFHVLAQDTPIPAPAKTPQVGEPPKPAPQISNEPPKPAPQNSGEPPRPAPQINNEPPKPQVNVEPPKPAPAKTPETITPQPTHSGEPPRPAPQISNEPPKPAPQNSGEPPRPAPQIHNEPPKPAPQNSGEPPRPAPQIHNEPPKPAPQIHNEPPKPAPQIHNEPPKPAPQNSGSPPDETSSKEVTTTRDNIEKQQTEITKNITNTIPPSEASSVGETQATTQDNIITVSITVTFGPAATQETRDKFCACWIAFLEAISETNVKFDKKCTWTKVIVAKRQAGSTETATTKSLTQPLNGASGSIVSIFAIFVVSLLLLVF